MFRDKSGVQMSRDHISSQSNFESSNELFSAILDIPDFIE